MDLQARWEHLWSFTTNDATSIHAAFARVCSRYTEPHRAYHTLQHIQDCLAVFDTFRELTSDPRAVEAALWWHDLIYDTSGTKDNERASAEVAQIDMGLLLCAPGFQERVVAMIIATNHDSFVTNCDQQLVLDIDLSSLGASPICYKQYVTGIRREYEKVPWEMYRHKRAEVLQSFLNREHIYYLPELRKRYEYAARRNIRREIAFLRKT
jgi:predicted metal-dependent HD superfamily phosphohydrolase